jgi:hypothetical protein
LEEGISSTRIRIKNEFDGSFWDVSLLRPNSLYIFTLLSFLLAVVAFPTPERLRGLEFDRKEEGGRRKEEVESFAPPALSPTWFRRTPVYSYEIG